MLPPEHSQHQPGTCCTTTPLLSPSCPAHDRHREHRVLITHLVTWVSNRPHSLVTCLASHSATHATSASLRCLVCPKQGEFSQTLQIRASLATGRAPAKSQQLIPRGKVQTLVSQSYFQQQFPKQPTQSALLPRKLLAPEAKV